MKSPSITFERICKHPAYWLAFGFGSGLLPKAPGTWGTLVAIPLFLLMNLCPLWLYAVLTILLFVLGIWLCKVTSRDLKIGDHPGIVWDEIVGYLITLIGLPSRFDTIVLGFIFFRLFDITKPWPIRFLEKRYPNGFGIMVDDVVAALYAALLLNAVLLYTHV